LPTDRAQINCKVTSGYIDALEKECDDLSKILLQNATFIKHLSSELDSYDIQGLLDYESHILGQGENYLNMQLLNPDIFILKSDFNQYVEE
jgi:hypothetical protein